jgi:hypothetical protein
MRDNACIHTKIRVARFLVLEHVVGDLTPQELVMSVDNEVFLLEAEGNQLIWDTSCMEYKGRNKKTSARNNEELRLQYLEISGLK